MSKRIVLVVNPNAGNGATGKEWPKIRSRASERLGPFETRVTSGPLDATRFAREAALSGADILVCVGGDGTLNEVINGLMNDRAPIEPGLLLGYLPLGTGCDLSRSMPFARDLDTAFDNILNGRSCSVDIGLLTYKDHKGREESRYFHNVLSFGLGGEVDERVNRSTKALGGFLSFIWATLVSILFYNKKRILLRVDDYFDEEVVTWNVAVANGKYHGGGMRVAPDAVLDDGLFHVTVIGDLSLAEVCWHIRRLYIGNIYDVKKVKSLTGRRVVAASSQPVLLDMDGEQPGCLPVEVEILPTALRIISS